MGQSHPWTPEEDAVLRQVYPTGGARAVQEYLPHRAISAIWQRAWHLRLARKRKWTRKEDEFLQKYYSTMPTAELARKLGRTEQAIFVRASKVLQLRKDTGARMKPTGPMRDFLRRLVVYWEQAKAQGIEKPDIGGFMWRYRQEYAKRRESHANM